VRALYDYHSSDATNLSFQAGSLIRVLNQLPSGWWDGCVDGERGWFPCNFVSEIEGIALNDEEDFLDVNESDSDESNVESVGDAESAVGTDISQMVAEEFTWVPQVDSQGRTFYVNTQNGATSWEMPATRVFVDDWNDGQLSDDDGEPRSSMDSVDSEDILMLGPIEPEYRVPDEFIVLTCPIYLIAATIHSISFFQSLVHTY
jgi:SH3 domain/WW domain